MPQPDVVTNFFTKKRKRQSTDLSNSKKLRKNTCSADSTLGKTDNSKVSLNSYSFIKQPLNKKTSSIKNYFSSAKTSESDLSSTKQIHSADLSISCTDKANNKTLLNNNVPDSCAQVTVEFSAVQSRNKVSNQQSATNKNLEQLTKKRASLEDLQQTLLQIKKSKEKIKSLHKQNDEKSKSINSSENKEFAFSKYHSLSQDISKGLILPCKYLALYELFQGLDTIVSMLYNRQEEISWSKVEKMVQGASRKKFTINHLAQIKHVFPDAYEYKCDSNEKNTRLSCNRQSKYELTFVPLLDCEERNSGLDMKLTGSMLVKRKHHFYKKLLDMVKEHHNKFLYNLQPPLKINDKDLKRWHPQFPVDTIPDIPFSALPSPPKQEYACCNTAKEVFEKARSKLTKTAAIALEKAAMLNSDDCSISCDTGNSIDDVKDNDIVKTESTTNLQGVSLSLINKIRKKEAEKKVTKMLRSEEIIEKLDQLNKLPGVARALRMAFANEKRTSLPMPYLCLKLSKSCHLISDPASTNQHLQLMSNIVPSWFNVINIQGKEYGKLVGSRLSISDVLHQIDEHRKAVEKL